MKQWNPELKPKKFASALQFIELNTKNHYADFDKPPASIPEMPKKKSCPQCKSKLTSLFINKRGNWMCQCLACHFQFAPRSRFY